MGVSVVNDLFVCFTWSITSVLRQDPTIIKMSIVPHILNTGEEGVKASILVGSQALERTDTILSLSVNKSQLASQRRLVC